jgi:ubiquinone/menaquinone biosynthesis C-methylase UbiE
MLLLSREAGMSKPVDPFRVTNRLDAPVLEAIALRLETRGRHPLFAAPLVQYLDRMDIDARSDVLDLGCGTGIAARSIAGRPGFKGQVLGIDLSEHLVQAAARLAADEGLAQRVRFKAGDSHGLDLQPASFDAVIAHTLFSHLDDPAQVLAEMRRVLRPAGVIAIFDGDYASLTFELGDEAHSRRMDEALIASLVTNPRIMRRLPRLLRQAGFGIAAVLPTIIAEAGVAAFWKNSIDAYAGLAPGAGLLTSAEAAGWRDELLAASADGVFFGSCVYYAYIAHIAG